MMCWSSPSEARTTTLARLASRIMQSSSSRKWRPGASTNEWSTPASARTRRTSRCSRASQMVGSFAEFERAMIRERTSAGVAAARAEGRVGGRRKKLDAAKRREIAESVITGRKSGAEMARLYNISQPTVSRIVAQHRMASP